MFFCQADSLSESEDELLALKDNVQSSVFREFLIVDNSVIIYLFVSLFFVLFLGHVLSDLKTCLKF